MTRSGRRIQGLGQRILWGLIFAGALGGLPAQATPNRYEVQALEEESMKSFRRILTMWQEESFFELYDEGWADSKKRITREDFAQRMVGQNWVPVGRPDPRFLKADFRFRTMVYIRAKLTFQNKANKKNLTRDLNMLLLKEADGRWKVDLVELVRIPYGGA
ncbi:MAG: hypothetical protein OEV94_10800 [Deltaproteobacteria bacterium]|nr:hypothetical protein [Deltaproteobacteria bacterium]